MTRLPLLWRVFLSTSLFTTVLFVLIGALVQNHALQTTSVMLEEELQASLRAYESLWRARAEYLASVSQLISGMPDVRAAFGTGDRATIRDTAGEVWGRVSRADAVFFVTDPTGRVIASLGGGAAPAAIEAVESVAPRFPEQASGFWFAADRLYRVVITPVYVQSGRGPALINILVAGFPVDNESAASLKSSTSGTDVVIAAGGRTIASTLPAAADLEGYSQLATQLNDVTGKPIGELRFLRPVATASRRIRELRLQIAAIWAAAMLFSLLVTFIVAQRLLRPIRLLGQAAAEIGRGNYEYRVPLEGDDETGRLGQAFNAMCKSIRDSREELIRQERVNTLGRVATSVVHDLRNPLAAIYSGSELLVDSDGTLPAAHTQRLASNIYRASRQVLNLLDDLMGLARGSAPVPEVCRLAEVVEDAWTSVEQDAGAVRLRMHGDTTVEVDVERSRVQRVFVNLFVNAIQAMPSGGEISVGIHQSGAVTTVSIRDTGPGIPEKIRGSLFQPFTTAGKSNGLGLGLALSRQTLLDHGGDLRLEDSQRGAAFQVVLPRHVARALTG